MDINTLKITPEILNLIAEIDEFKGSWKALGMLAPERLAALIKVTTIESIGCSTRIEGARLSDRHSIKSDSYRLVEEKIVATYPN